MARKHTNVELVYRKLRERLLNCRILPGARIKISAEATRLAVSPGAVREALSRLTAENLAVLEPLKGFRAAALSCEASRDLLDARIEVESICLRLSIHSADRTWERTLARSHRRLVELEADRAPPGADAWEAAHTDFHDALLAGCSNVTLLQFRTGLLERSQRLLGLAKLISGNSRDLLREHLALYAAARRRDVDAAVAELRNHILLTRQTIASAMEHPDWAARLQATAKPRKLPERLRHSEKRIVPNTIA